MAGLISYEHASQLLGGITRESTPTEILTSFKNLHDNMATNNLDEDDLKVARNVLIQDSVCRQIEEHRYFEIVSPFENSCIVCQGSGEIYKFVKKPVDVNCHICAGKGKIKTIIKIQCQRCKKTPGRHIKRWREGGGINVTCKFCNDGFNNQVKMTKCNKCLGEGTIEKPVLSHEIKSTTPCNRCQQRGFIKPKTPKKKHYYPVILNPVITQNLAMKIKEQTDESDTHPAE